MIWEYHQSCGLMDRDGVQNLCRCPNKMGTLGSSRAAWEIHVEITLLEFPSLKVFLALFILQRSDSLPQICSVIQVTLLALPSTHCLQNYIHVLYRNLQCPQRKHARPRKIIFLLNILVRSPQSRTSDKTLSAGGLFGKSSWEAG